MKNKKEECGQLYKRWKELEGKLPKAQILKPGEKYNSSHILSEELIEFHKITKELGNKCRDFLSPGDRFEIERRVRLDGRLK